jgi:hypothetical protein
MTDLEQMLQTLIRMGLDPTKLQAAPDLSAAAGSGSDKLPPLPPSDAGSMQRNHYDPYYKRTSRDFWNEAQITQNRVQEFPKCQHYLMKENNEARCTLCHVGWVVPDSFHTQDGKLFDGATPLQFAL